MSSAFRALTKGLAATAALGISLGAAAQDTVRPGQGYVGIEIGKPHYATSCGNIAGLSCSNNGTSYSVVAGDMITTNIGAELSFLDLGNADRAGGSVSARGMNMSLLGRVPVGDSFSLEGKIGATYGITHVSADENAGIATGRASGLGLGYGVGLDIHVVRGLHGEVGWEQHKFHFVGQGTQNVNDVTVGLAYNF